MFSRAGLTTLLVPIIGIVVYFLLQGDQGNVQHFYRDDNFLYVSQGDFGVCEVYEYRRSHNVQSRPPTSQEVKKAIFPPFQPLKSQRKLTKPTHQIRINFQDINQVVAANNWLYVIDFERGLRIYNNQDSKAPKFVSEYQFFGIRNLEVFENIGFVAAGANGVYIMDLKDPAQPQILHHIDTDGFAHKAIPVVIKLPVTTEYKVDQSGDQAQNKTKTWFLLYIADGPGGLLVYEFHSNDPKTILPTQLTQYDTVDDALDVHFSELFIYLAEDKSGIELLTAFDGENNPQKPSQVALLPVEGSVTQVIEHNKTVFAVTGENGILIAKRYFDNNSYNLERITQFTGAGAVDYIMTEQDLAFLAHGVEGFSVVDISNPVEPVVRQTLPTPGLANTAQIFAALANADKLNDKIKNSFRDIFKELFLSALLVVVWIAFFSPFALPYESPEKLGQAVNTFLTYLVRRHGRVILVENGRIVSHLPLIDQSSLRPVIMDNASAGLVLNAQDTPRVIGPGVSLLQPRERLVKVIDLHQRTFAYGPKNNEDPFASKQTNESDGMYNLRQARFAETRAVTRDGIEIAPSMVIYFQIKGLIDPQRAPFGFHPDYALQALLLAYQKDRGNLFVNLTSPLNRLPGELAARVWRECLARVEFKDLFFAYGDPPPGESAGSATGFEVIRSVIQQQLTQPQADELDAFGRLTGRQVISEAFNTLENAGLKVAEVRIEDLKIAPQSIDQHWRDWLTGWPAWEAQLASALEARVKEMQGLGRQAGALAFVRPAAEQMSSAIQRYQMVPGYLLLNRSLSVVLRGISSIDSISQTDQLRLAEIIDWLESTLE